MRRGILQVSLFTGVLTLAGLVVLALTGLFTGRNVLSLFLGAAVGLGNFMLLGAGLELLLRKKATSAGGGAGIFYLLRLTLIGIVVYWSIQAPYLNYVPVVIGLVFPSLSIWLAGFLQRRDKHERS
jgi:NADH:ubiquinone oxidoreductase subunit K